MADLDTKLPDATEAPLGASVTNLRALAVGGGGGDATKFLDGSGNFSAPGGGGVTIQSTGPIAISSAELLALHDSPVAIIPAPGAGKFIAPIFATLDYHYGTTDYSETGIDFFWGTVTDADMYGQMNDPIAVSGGDAFGVSNYVVGFGTKQVFRRL